MFHAVRRWWGSGRGKISARLFLFELLVVIVGVLIAQGLANLVSNQATQRQVSEERARLDFEIGRTRQASRVWVAAIPCLRARVDAMIAAAESGSNAFSADDIVMPGGGYYSVEPISEDIARPFRERYGADRTDTYFLANTISRRVADRIYQTREEWSKFGLLTLANGQLSEIDKSELRNTGIRLRFLLRTIDVQSQALDKLGGDLHIAPLGAGKALTGPDRPAASCQEIWRNNNIYHLDGS